MIVVGTVGNTRSRVPVNSVVCFYVVFGDVVVEVTILVARSCSFSRVVKVSAGLTDISGLTVGALDLINCSWSVFRFVFVLNISE